MLWSKLQSKEMRDWSASQSDCGETPHDHLTTAQSSSQSGGDIRQRGFPTEKLYEVGTLGPIHIAPEYSYAGPACADHRPIVAGPVATSSSDGAAFHCLRPVVNRNGFPECHCFSRTRAALRASDKACTACATCQRLVAHCTRILSRIPPPLHRDADANSSPHTIRCHSKSGNRVTSNAVYITGCDGQRLPRQTV
jgi:hypothetical protein